MKKLSSLLIAAACTSGLVLSSPASAVPSGGGSTTTTTTPKTSPKKLKCKRGQVAKPYMSKGTKKYHCVRATADALPKDELYEQGKELALEGEYSWALDVLEVADQSNPDVLNMQGYSHRKAGRLDVAVGLYQRALTINPDFVRAREYLGEGYAAAGKLDLAKGQLAEIEKRCGVTCEEYIDLSKAINAASN